MEQRWQEIVTLAESAQHPSADFDFYYGIALAQLARWKDAEQAFIAGARLQPADKRFPLELAGVAFKQKRYVPAVRHLRRPCAWMQTILMRTIFSAPSTFCRATSKRR